jgi:hypothetical protein
VETGSIPGWCIHFGRFFPLCFFLFLDLHFLLGFFIGSTYKPENKVCLCPARIWSGRESKRCVSDAIIIILPLLSSARTLNLNGTTDRHAVLPPCPNTKAEVDLEYQTRA